MSASKCDVPSLLDDDDDPVDDDQVDDAGTRVAASFPPEAVSTSENIAPEGGLVPSLLDADDDDFDPTFASDSGRPVVAPFPSPGSSIPVLHRDHDDDSVAGFTDIAGELAIGRQFAAAVGERERPGGPIAA